MRLSHASSRSDPALLWGEELVEATTAEGLTRARRKELLVLGPLVELWHYVRTAPARLTTAARRAKNATARDLWLHLATDEEAWAGELKAGLEAAVGEAELASAQPLPGTFVVCGQMRRAAEARDAADQLGYAACVGAAARAAASPCRQAAPVSRASRGKLR